MGARVRRRLREGDEKGSPDAGLFFAEVTIPNKKGLHARASAQFVRTASSFDARVNVTREGHTVGGTSIMGLMMLAAGQGHSILIEARDSGRLPEIVAFAPEGARHPRAAEIIAATEAAGGEAIETTHDILAKMSGKDNPQMLLGAYRETDPSLERIDRSKAPLWIVAQALRDPGNIGTILRTGDAVGAGGLILIDDSADPFSVEAVRASMGAVFTQEIAAARWPEFIAWLRGGEGQLVGTSLKATQDYLETEYRRPCFLLIGNEQQGLPTEYEAECDLLVKIPMAGRADSLNAAMATAVMAFAIKASWR
jgi:TrmH family RNA methyltransferase